MTHLAAHNTTTSSISGTGSTRIAPGNTLTVNNIRRINAATNPSASQSAIAPPAMPDVRVAGRYQLKSKLGAGSFGEIYRGLDLHRGVEVAIKLELHSVQHPQLNFESKMYKAVTGGNYIVVGIPEVLHAGVEGDYNVLILDLLGPNLEDLFNYCLRRFSIKTVCLLAEQMLYRLEHIHQRGVIHRDQKPENWVMGLGDQSHCVYLIDFGLAKKYVDPKRHNNHIPFRDGKSLTGTARYCSANAHRGYEQSRRDDLISMGYMLTYFLISILPWQGITGCDPAERTTRIGEKKMSTPLTDLCKGLPQPFFDFMKHCGELNFEDSPAYKTYRFQFRLILHQHSESRDFVFDWLVKRDKEREQEPPNQTPDTGSLVSGHAPTTHATTTAAAGAGAGAAHHE